MSHIDRFKVDVPEGTRGAWRVVEKEFGPIGTSDDTREFVRLMGIMRGFIVREFMVWSTHKADSGEDIGGTAVSSEVRSTDIMDGMIELSDALHNASAHIDVLIDKLRRGKIVACDDALSLLRKCNQHVRTARHRLSILEGDINAQM